MIASDLHVALQLKLAHSGIFSFIGLSPCYKPFTCQLWSALSECVGVFLL
jgi:hypothetical protein